MIKRQGDYLFFDDDAAQPASAPQVKNQPQQLLYTQGSVVERLAVIRQQINQLKAEKEARIKYSRNNQSVFTHLSQSQAEKFKRNPVDVQLHTPKELYDIGKRVYNIESKIGRAELYNQTVHRKGNLVDRVKVLQEKLEKLEKIPTESIMTNISSYHSLVENKEQHFKYLFLYDQFLKTQGLKEEYVTTKEYLQNLKYVHEQCALLNPSILKLQTIHEAILSKSDTAEKLYRDIYNQLQEDYKALNAELGQLEK